MPLVPASNPSLPPRPDRWWIIAGIAALVSMAMVALVWIAPTWPGTWIVAVGLLVYVFVVFLAPSRWYRRMTAACLGLAGASAGLPSLDAVFHLTGQASDASAEAAGNLVFDSAPYASPAFLLLAAFFAFLDFRSRYPQPALSTSIHARTSGASSPGIVEGDVTYNQGILDQETLRKIVNRYESDLGSRDKQIEELKAALSRVETAAAGGDPQARAAIKEARETGDIDKLQASLVHLADQLGEDIKLRMDEYVELCREIASVAYLRGDIDEARSRLQLILKANPNDVDAINGLGQIHLLRGELDAAVLSYQRVLDLSKDDKVGQSVAYTNLGMVLAVRGDLAGAEAMYRKAMEIDVKARDIEGMHANFINLGNLLFKRGDFDAAEVIYRNLVEIDERLKNAEGLAIAYGSLGAVLRTRGDLDGAEAIHREALEMNERLGRIEGIAIQYGHLGFVRYLRGDLDGAEALYDKAMEIHEKLGRVNGVVSTYCNLGLVFKARGDLDGAEAMFRKSLEICEAGGDLEFMARAYANLGTIQGMRGGFDDARASWIKARDLFRQIGLPQEVENVQSLLDVLPDSDA